MGIKESTLYFDDVTLADVDSKATNDDPTIRRTQTEWFATEVHAHESSLKAYLRRSFPTVRDVDDVVHESYLRILRQKAVRPIESTRAFLFTVARHLALDRLRSARRSPIEPSIDSAGADIRDDNPQLAETVGRNEKVQLLIDAIDALPARSREVVILRKLKLLSQKEVAERLKISEKGVEIQLSRGLDRCRQYLRRKGVVSFFGNE